MSNSKLATADTVDIAECLTIGPPIDFWSVYEAASLASTNLTAASLPPWTALRADLQTAGRGRFQRSWVSDQGGLWLSAVVPMPASMDAAPLLPLAAGLAVCEALEQLGIAGLHLRWPNDILHQRRKLAGILIDCFVPSAAVIGIGINVANQPESSDPALRGQICRLAELLAPVPPLSALMEVVLHSIRSVWQALEQGQTADLLERINGLWLPAVRVQIDLNGQIIQGQFGRVDSRGRLHLLMDDGASRFLEPHQVRLLRELT